MDIVWFGDVLITLLLFCTLCCPIFFLFVSFVFVCFAITALWNRDWPQPLCWGQAAAIPPLKKKRKKKAWYRTWRRANAMWRRTAKSESRAASPEASVDAVDVVPDGCRRVCTECSRGKIPLRVSALSAFYLLHTLQRCVQLLFCLEASLLQLLTY